MSIHSARIHWQRNDDAFAERRYSRRHTWQFDGGSVVVGSSSPHLVPAPYSDASAVDPEEAFVASLSSCHMLWFLDLAQRGGWVVDDYQDEAEGLMEDDIHRRWSVTRVTLRPVVRFGGDKRPTDDEHRRLHEQAHEACFIANSVRSEIVCVPTFSLEAP